MKWITKRIWIDIDTGETIIDHQNKYYKVKTFKKIWRIQNSKTEKWVREFHYIMRLKTAQQQTLNL